MDVAISTINNRKFNAINFSLLPENEKIFYKKSLKCIECGADASFRNTSKDGKSACFSAKHLIKDCGKSRPSNSKSNTKGTNEVNIRLANTNIIRFKRINYFSTKSVQNDILPDEYDFSNNGESTNTYTISPANDVIKDWSLSKILNHQLNDSFKDIDLYFDNSREIHINDILFNWDNITEIKEGLYWGYLSSYKNGWLNSDNNYPYENFSIQLDDDIDKLIWKSLPKINGSWNKKVPAIVMGTPSRSKNGKLYIKVTDVTSIYFNIRTYKSIVKDQKH